MSKALTGPDGKIRTYDDFRREAQNITGEHLKWLKTEYDTAIAGGQQAGKWVAIQADKDKFPLLQFDAVIDGHTSKICEPLNKVIRPVDDPFWQKYYPPNHFNCRSTVRQLRSGTETPVNKIPYPESVPEMFKYNVGEKGIIFPPGHAYYTDVPAHVLNNGTLYMPVADQYIIKYKSAEEVELSVNRKTDIAGGPDLKNLEELGKKLADKGYTIDILPEIHVNETSLRKVLLPGVEPAKNPDILINGEYAEVKTVNKPVTHHKLQLRIALAAKQADTAVIVLKEEYSTDQLEALANERFRALPDMERIAFVTTDGEYLEFVNDRGQQK